MPFDALMINSVEKVQGREYKVVFRIQSKTYCPLIKKETTCRLKAAGIDMISENITNTDALIF